MLKRTNINVTDGTAIMPYLVEYFDISNIDDTSYSIWYHIDEEAHECFLDISYEDEHEHLYARKNYWEELKRDENWTEWTPGSYENDLPIALMKVYFPEYSVETYDSHIYYIVKLTTYIQDWKVTIGCYLMNRIDSLACAPVKYLDKEYFEYQYLNIPDIWSIIYSDTFKTLREAIIGTTSSTETNDDCTVLSVQIIPAKAYDEYFIKHSTYFSSENSIEISKGDTDFMNLTIKQSFNESTHIPQIHAQLNFNEAYNNILADYLIETYSINSSDIVSGKIWVDYCLSAMNEDDIFKMMEVRKQVVENQEDSSSVEFSGERLQFENWAYLDKTISFNCIACITYRENETDEGEVLMEVKSDALPITQDIYRWWISRDLIDSTINHVDINDIENIEFDNMNILACNKIVKNIVAVPRPDNYKANIMKPVFFKSYDIEQIYIYSNANCTIAINLTKYYSQVEYFKIQIGSYTAQEYGRNAVGVLFKIDASQLDKSVESGIYYILDNNDEVISDGKYIFKDLAEQRLAIEQANNNNSNNANIEKEKIVAKPIKLEKQLEIVSKKTDMLIPKTFKEKADPIKLATMTPTPNKIKR